MRVLRLTLITVLVVGGSIVATPAASASPSVTALPTAVTAVDANTARARILADTNAARASAGLAPLSADTALDAVAQNCSQSQAANDAMAHCPGFADRYPSGWRWAGENVAMGYSLDAVVTGWMNSPGHRANILRADVTHIGIGYAVSASGRPYYTQNLATYPPGVRPPSTPQPVVAPVFRFFSPRLQGHFYTIRAEERDRVRATWPDVWTYEGERFTAFTSQQQGTVPLFRFWSAAYGSHFYTIDVAERDRVQRTWPDIWAYEGIAFYVLPKEYSDSQSLSVHRFWSPSSRHHFFTASTAERDRVMRLWPTVWSSEGVAFCVPISAVP